MVQQIFQQTEQGGRHVMRDSPSAMHGMFALHENLTGDVDDQIKKTCWLRPLSADFEIAARCSVPTWMQVRMSKVGS